MKQILAAAIMLGAATAWGALPPARPFSDYLVILERQPFGVPPEAAPEPERVIPVQESFAAQMVLSGIFELDDGNLRVSVVDRRDNSYFSLMVGEKDEPSGVELLDVDYEKEEAVLKKAEEVVVLRMSGSSGTQVLSTSEREDRMKQAEERRLGYAERRRARQLARQQPQPPPTPLYSGQELEKHLQETQMDAIRKGLPPLPVQLTAENDAQLVAEGFLPAVDEEGFEIDDEEYYEDDYAY